jgi:DNA-binding PadR family transcriptional regulator
LLSDQLLGFNSDSGAVYRSLRQLEDEGSVISDWDTIGTGAPRRIYKITSLGWDKLAEWEQNIKPRITNLNYFVETYNELKNNRTVKGEP